MARGHADLVQGGDHVSRGIQAGDARLLVRIDDDLAVARALRAQGRGELHARTAAERRIHGVEHVLRAVGGAHARAPVTGHDVTMPFAGHPPLIQIKG